MVKLNSGSSSSHMYVHVSFIVFVCVCLCTVATAALHTMQYSITAMKHYTMHMEKTLNDTI